MTTETTSASTVSSSSLIVLNQLSPIAKTAYDSIQAKQSAINVGYDMVVTNQYVYEYYINEMAIALMTMGGGGVESWSNNETSSSSSSSTEATAEIEEGHRHHRCRCRRQTPLVNAGYASRVMAISSSIRNFIQFHQWMEQQQSPTPPQTKQSPQQQDQRKCDEYVKGMDINNNNSNNNIHHKKKTKIQIVILGCGVDVTGLWAHSLVMQATAAEDSALDVTIIELDQVDVCTIKKDILSSHNMVHFQHHHHRDDADGTRHDSDEKVRSSSHETIFVGTIVPVALPLNGRQQDGSDTIPPSPSPVGDNETNNNTANYVLVSTDLKDIPSLDSCIEQLCTMSLFSTAVPTLVLSELVLAYLPPTCTDRLLSWCYTKLGMKTTSGSAIVALEPYGSKEDDNEDEWNDTTHETNIVVPVEDGYRNDYCKKFQAKMVRGKSTNLKPQDNDHVKDTGDADTNTTTTGTANFHPIGTSTESISLRFEKAGFRNISITSLGKAAAIASAGITVSSDKTATTATSTTLICPEILDEHAALVLHLQSYVIICGFSATATTTTSIKSTKNNNNYVDRSDRLHQNLLSPWERPHACTMSRASIPDIDLTLKVAYAEIEPTDEVYVQRLFEHTYIKYMEEYPAIRKLVKNVLLKELRVTTTKPTTRTNHHHHNHHYHHHGRITTSDVITGGINLSVIGNHYRSRGGIFLVAIRNFQGCIDENAFAEELRGDSDDVPTTSTPSCRVVGCVGIRHEESSTNGSYSRKNGVVDDVDDHDHDSLEIFRLAVDESCRGIGIGKGLLQAVERFARVRRQRPATDSRHRPIRVVANTLTILDPACKVYESLGYIIEKDTALGGTKLVIRTYVKYIPVHEEGSQAVGL